MTELTPRPEDFLGNPDPAIWAEIEGFARNNDEHSAALLSLRARVEQLEANAKPTSSFDQIRSSGITPPPELVQEWMAATESNDCIGALPTNFEQRICTSAAQWGADTELEACVEWINKQSKIWTSDQLRAARRPKPPSLKKQALQEVDALEGMGTCNIDTIRRALEQLDD